MNDAQIRGFARIVERGTMAAAAQALFISPQALQQQINSLERELGVQLLVRDRSGCTPTEAGSAFYRGAVSMLDTLAVAVDAARQANQTRGHVVKVADHGLIQDPLGFDVNARFLATHPDVLIDSRQLAHAETNSCDILGGDVECDPSLYALRNKVRTQVFLTMTKDSALIDRVADDGSLCFDALEGMPVAVPIVRLPQGIEPPVVSRIYSLGSPRTITYAPTFNLSSVDYALAHGSVVQLSYGPRYLDSSRFVQVPLRDSAFEYRIFINRGVDDPLAEELLEFVCRCYDDEWDEAVEALGRSTGPGHVEKD